MMSSSCASCAELPVEGAERMVLVSMIFLQVSAAFSSMPRMILVPQMVTCLAPVEDIISP